MARKICIAEKGGGSSSDVVYNVVIEDTSLVDSILSSVQDYIESENTVIYGTGEPSPTSGQDGDIYIDSSTQDAYIKQDGVWNKIDVPGPGPTPPTPVDLPDSYITILGSLSNEIGGVIE